MIQDLAQRLLTLDAADAPELIAHEVGFDHEHLFFEAEQARTRARSAQRAMAEEHHRVADLLDQAALYALRQVGTAPNPQRGSAAPEESGEQPLVPVTVDLDFVNSHIDHAGDFGTFIVELMKWVHRAMTIAGEAELAKTLKDEIVALVESPDHTGEDILASIERYVYLR